ncbi:MAG TPA: AMP-binding protein [Lacunisphaera sp.]|nr:AMP-binding protein [Lacunisphaera sp.]
MKSGTGSRSDFARLLGAPAGMVAEPRGGATVVWFGKPGKFMADLAVAAAQGGPVLLASEAWGETERSQLAALTIAAGNTPVHAAGRGWLGIPTGGSSGRLKFARHDEETIGAAVRGFAEHFGLAPVNAAGVLPLHHVSGLMAWMRCALTGGEYRPLDWKRVESGAGPRLGERPAGWCLSLVPTQLERLLRTGQTLEWLRQFRIIFVGGAPTASPLLDRAASLGLPLSLGYGMTETAAMVTGLPPREFMAGARHAGSTLPHARVAIDHEGSIAVGGDSLFRGYWPEWRDGVDFLTGDRGWLNEAGQLHVLGRRDAVIITGGEKVDPAEVEHALRQTGEFIEVVVTGAPDAEWGQVVVAAHPEATRPDLAKVNTALARTLAPAKRPKRFLALPDWPVTEQGKVNRAEVVRRLTAR